jgi:protein-L-isoaspartate(D-aspartate) O-methyltransferase
MDSLYSKVSTENSNFIDPCNISNEFQAIVHDITCQICLNIVQPPPISCASCFKMFCKTCIDNWVRISKRCPNNHNYVEFKNILAINMLSKFSFACSIKDCGKQILYEDYFEHLNKCDYGSYQCSACKLIATKLNIINHVNICDQIEENCKFCLGKFKRAIINSHIIICDERLIECEDCKKIFKFKELENHNSKCLEKKIKCGNCHMEFKRKAEKKHFKKICLIETKKLLDQKLLIIESLENNIEKKLITIENLEKKLNNYEDQIGTLKEENKRLKCENKNSNILFPNNPFTYNTKITETKISEENKILFSGVFEKYNSFNFKKELKNILFETDRAEFINLEINSEDNIYKDTPLSIGFKTSISAPHMHSMTLLYLDSYLERKSSLFSLSSTTKALDLGSGSGYMTVCISKLLGVNSITYAVEHISEILEFSKSNIKRSHDYMISSGRIKFFCLDAREPIFQDEKFDVIHFGAAYDHFPESYKKIMSIGAVAWIPVGKGTNQKIKIYKKISENEFKEYEVMQVRYAELGSKENQIK